MTDMYGWYGLYNIVRTLTDGVSILRITAARMTVLPVYCPVNGHFWLDARQMHLFAALRQAGYAGG